ncbi:MAG: ABC transporter permease, partial [Marinoscillum sp.]
MENKKSRIPKLGRWLIALFVAEDKQDLIIGDFEEYLEGAQLERKSILWSFWVQFFSSFPAFVQQAVHTRLMLFQHAIRITLRTMRMHHSHFLLNVTGLSLGIACFTIIMLYVEQEKSYDKFHAKSQRIYRINDVRKSDGIGEESSSAPIPLANAMLLDYEGQIESAVRFFNFQAPSLSVAYEPNAGFRRQFNESRVFFVDSTLFEIFDFQLINGNKKTVLDGPNKVLITQDMAEKYFENVDPIGQTLVLEGKQDLMVSGVLRNSPANSHIQFDFLVSFATLNNPRMLSDRLRTNWIWNPCWTYVLLNQSVQPETLEAQFPDFVEKYFPESRKNRVKLYLQPLEDIHLHSHLDYEMRANGDIIYVYIFTSVAIFILIISYINFINLTTARSLTRHKEIGLRKVLGGSKVQLIWQFLSESIVTNLIAFVISIVLVFALVEMLGS